MVGCFSRDLESLYVIWMQPCVIIPQGRLTGKKIWIYLPLPELGELHNRWSFSLTLWRIGHMVLRRKHQTDCLSDIPIIEQTMSFPPLLFICTVKHRKQTKINTLLTFKYYNASRPLSSIFFLSISLPFFSPSCLLLFLSFLHHKELLW